MRASPRTPTLAAAVGITVVVLALTAAPARASVCCMTSGIFGVGRLALWEQSAAGLRVTGATTLGSWDAQGLWRPNPSGYLDHELRFEVYGLLRLSERGQLYASVPVLVNQRGVGDDVATAGGVGDIEVGARHELLQIGERAGLPAVNASVALLLPSGVRPEEARQPFDVDATGRSALGASGSLSAEQAFGRLFARLDVGGVVYAPFVRADLLRQQRYGPSLAASASFGGVALEQLILGVVLGATHDLPIVMDRHELPDSDATLGSLGLVASWALDAHWTMLASASSGAFLDDLGQNRPGRITASLGARYGHF